MLSRSLAESGIYPAIDIEASLSRLAAEITTPEHQQLARRLRQLVSAHQQQKDLISIGAYVKGSDARVDQAIALWPRIEEFLRQDVYEGADFATSLNQLKGLLK